jgi:hypothetical protein
VGGASANCSHHRSACRAQIDLTRLLPHLPQDVAPQTAAKESEQWTAVAIASELDPGADKPTMDCATSVKVAVFAAAGKPPINSVKTELATAYTQAIVVSIKPSIQRTCFGGPAAPGPWFQSLATSSRPQPSPAFRRIGQLGIACRARRGVEPRRLEGTASSKDLARILI